MIMSSTSKTIHDPVHGTILLDPVLLAIIDTPQFQRLRDIKQLGTACYIFPGATHTRFEHSIGTSYLCGKFLSTLRDLHKNVYTTDEEQKFTIDEKDILCVKIAGLIHDLGHGPFSHFFEKDLMKNVMPERNWKHEEGSTNLFQHLLECNNEVKEKLEEKGIRNNEIKRIKNMIYGENKDNDEKHFLYEIVANKETGIDCDKFDYIARDTLHLGMKNSFDFQRYFLNTKIVKRDGKWRICVRDKEECNLYELFHVRMTLHRQVYQHKTEKAFNHMFCDIFKMVDGIFGISKSVDNKEAFTSMTDSVIYDLLRRTDDSEGIKNAKKVLRRIEMRDIYQFCGRIINPDVNKSGDIINALTIENDDIKSFIRVSRVDFNFSKNGKNPIEKVFFFDKNGQSTEPQVTQLSDVDPVYFNVYCTDKDKCERITKAVENYNVKNSPRKTPPSTKH